MHNNKTHDYKLGMPAIKYVSRTSRLSTYALYVDSLMKLFDEFTKA